MPAPVHVRSVFDHLAFEVLLKNPDAGHLRQYPGIPVQKLLPPNNLFGEKEPVSGSLFYPTIGHWDKVLGFHNKTVPDFLINLLGPTLKRHED